MISAWKSQCREAIDAEMLPGKVVTDVDLEAMVTEQMNVIEEFSRKKPKTSEGNSGDDEIPVAEPVGSLATVESAPLSEQPAPAVSKQYKYTLPSRMFLEDELGEDVFKFLSSV